MSSIHFLPCMDEEEHLENCLRQKVAP